MSPTVFFSECWNIIGLDGLNLGRCNCPQNWRDVCTDVSCTCIGDGLSNSHRFISRRQHLPTVLSFRTPCHIHRLLWYCGSQPSFNAWGCGRQGTGMRFGEEGAIDILVTWNRFVIITAISYFVVCQAARRSRKAHIYCRFLTRHEISQFAERTRPNIALLPLPYFVPIPPF